ncbi:hypothetical protein [Argonema antarcticum]|uniref:hypothetical protein n=1 Tax=Argonema antarcticum TaxID=2942763 RepID=UPI002011C478|nr:hypothetical protein [Argonema antarcticum]MCL1472281.1 hypothetical protein [Argonema antarcticum A004/B2]
MKQTNLQELKEQILLEETEPLAIEYNGRLVGYFYPVSAMPSAMEEIDRTFTNLVQLWRNETIGISSTTDLVMHPAYQQIITMGPVVIPLLLREVERKSGRWFWALCEITGEDPVPLEKRGKTKEMTQFWLEWGKAKGYKW